MFECIFRWCRVAFPSFGHCHLGHDLCPGKKQLYQNMVMLHIKLKGMQCTATYKQNFFPFTHPRPMSGVKEKKIFFWKKVLLHIKIKSLPRTTAYKQYVCPYTYPQSLWCCLKVKAVFYRKEVMLHIKIKGVKCTITCKQILYPYTHLWPLVKMSKHCFLLKVVLCISNEQEGLSCTYNSHLYHKWVAGVVELFYPVGDSCIA